MSEKDINPVLSYIVNTLKRAIADSKIENPSPNEYKIIDGNDEILLKQEDDKKGNPQILITDKRNIIFSEDLLERLQNLHEEVKGDPQLKESIHKSLIIINELDIETELVFQAIKDFFDQLSNSYEFIKAVETNVNMIGAGFKFGKHIFRLNIINELEKISIEPRFTPTFDPSIKKTITDDIDKVQVAVNKMFGKTL